MAQRSIEQRVKHRTRILQGQLAALVKMIDHGEYCIDILTQSLAIQKSLASLNNLILGHHLESCATKQMKTGQQNQAIKEIMEVYKLTQRS